MCWHNRNVRSKLLLCGYPQNFSSGRKLLICKLFDDISSKTYPLNADIPQDSVLSSTLSSLHMHDLLSATSNPMYSFAHIILISFFSSVRHLSVSISRNLEWISDWDIRKLDDFNATKNQYTSFSLKTSCLGHNIVMSGNDVASNSYRSLDCRFQIRFHMQRLRFLYRARKFFSDQPNTSPNGVHVWNTAPTAYLQLLNLI